MEKTSLPSRVHVSEDTFAKIRDVCEFEEGEEAILDNATPPIPTFFAPSSPLSSRPFSISNPPFSLSFYFFRYTNMKILYQFDGLLRDSS